MKTNRILLIAILVVNVLGLGYLATNTSGGTSANIKADVLEALKENDAAQAGGEANYKLLQELYSNKKFQKTQNDSLKKTLEQINAVPKKEINEGTLSKEDLTSVTKDIIVQGKEDAKFLLVEYTDIQCPACKGYHSTKTTEKAIEANADDLKAVAKHFPLSFHKDAQPAAEAVECAKDQTDAKTTYKFLSALFTARDLSTDGILKEAKETGIDDKKIKACMEAGTKTQIVKDQMKEGMSIFKVGGTPTLILINTETGKYKKASRSVDRITADINELR